MYSIQDYFIYIPILFVIIFIFLKLFERIKLDWRFLILIPPYILIGILIRLLADVGKIEFNQLYSVTPGVYIVTILLASSFILLGFLTKKLIGLDYWVLPFISGLIISLYLVYQLSYYLINPEWIPYPVLLAIFITLAVYSLSILLKIDIFQRVSNLGIIFAHLLDGSATFLAYNYFNFYEEHLLPRYLISLAGDNAFIMIPLKLFIILLVLYFIEKWYQEEKRTEKSYNLYTLIKLVIFVIGIGPGIRNTMLPALKL